MSTSYIAAFNQEIMARKSTKVPSVAVDGHANEHSTTTEKRSLIIDNEEDVQSSKRTKLSSRTDYSRWRMLDERGRQTWHYLEDDQAAEKWPQTTADRWFLGLPTVRTSQIMIIIPGS
jgi:hypothetical protein